MIAKSSRRTAILFALLILTADITAGLGVFSAVEDLIPGDIGSETRPTGEDLPGFLVDATERSVEGGGPLLLFVDPVTPSDPPVQGIYTGATAAVDEESPGRWRHDWDAWGQATLNGPSSDVWRTADGFWQHGVGFGPTATYASGSVSELITPAVDLRSVEVDGPSTDGPQPVEPVGCGGGTADDGACTPSKEAGDQMEANQEVKVRAADVALRVRHAYDFAFTANLDGTPSEFNDGGRVEVSVFDQAHGEWADWTPLTPTYDHLQIGEGNIEGRLLISDGQDGTPASVQVNSPPQQPGDAINDPANATPIPDMGAEVETDALAQNEEELHRLTSGVAEPEEPVFSDDEATLYAGTNTSRPPSDSGDMAAPFLYRGPITSSPSKWSGFGAESGGLVESVFDLSPWAGDMVRLRFHTATADEPKSGDFGWVLDQVEVHANGEPGIDIMGLLEPTDGALIPEDAVLFPSAVVHNRGRQPLDVRMDFTIDGGDTAYANVRLGVGADARASATLDGRSFGSLRDPGRDLHSILVEARPTAASYSQADDVVDPLSAATFHVMEGRRPSWEATSMDLVVLKEGQDNGKLESEPATNIQRGEPARLQVTVQNQDSIPRWIDPNKDLVPVLLTQAGQAVGSAVLDPHPDAAPNGSILLPPTRATSGSLGDANPQRTITWTWTAPPVAQVLAFELHDHAGTAVFDAGKIYVEAVRAPALDLDYLNPWTWSDDCQRLAEVGDVHGVVACNGPGTLDSSAAALTPILRDRGDRLGLSVSYRGASAQALLYGNETSELDAPPGPEVNWTLLGTVELDATPDQWRTTSNSSIDLPPDWTGWLRLSINPVDDFELDRGQIQLLDHEGRSLVIHDADFDASAAPEEQTVRATSPTGLLRLEVPIGCRTSSCSSIVDTLEVRRGGDAFACLSDPVDLSETIRPFLNFRHWLSPDASEKAIVEVMRAEGASAPPSCGDGEQWTQLWSDSKATSGFDTRPEALSLQPWTGERIFLRFHLQQVPNTDIEPSENLGWFIEGLRVSSLSTSVHNGSVYRSPENFTDMDTAGVVDAMDSYEVAPSHWKPVDGDPNHHFSDSSWVRPASFITEPMSLDSFLVPTFTVEHTYTSSWRQQNPSNEWSRHGPVADLQYQFLDEDGNWPAQWISAAPFDEDTLEPLLDDPGASLPDGSPALALRDPETHDTVGPPFSFVHPDIFLNPGGSVRYDDVVHRFDLTPLQEASAGSPVRFRLVGWGDATNLDWDLHALQVASYGHFTDAAIKEVRLASDDRDAVEKHAREQGLVLPESTDVYISNDRAIIEVDVQNPGIYTVNAAVDLAATDADGTAVNIRAVTGGGGQVTLVDDLKPGSTQTVEFIADLRKSEPGAYTFRADVLLTDALDTNPDNDARVLKARLLPIRDIRLDPVESQMVPFVTGPDGERQLNVKIVNQGNVDESEVHVDAEIVRVTGLTTTEPTGLHLQPKDPLHLPRRGGTPDGPITWNLKDSLAPSEKTSDYIEPGQKYAAKVTVRTGSESVLQWWGSDAGTPIVETMDPFTDDSQDGALWNVTQPEDTHCRCLLVPFLAEDLLYRTELGGSPGLSRLDQAFPATEEPEADGWTTQSYADGELLSGTERPDIPRWELAAGDDPVLAGFTGEAEGDAWALPAYDGRSIVEHRLTSPALPSQVVQSTSKAILGMRYASGVEEGDVQLQVRTQAGDTWSDWAPVDDVRSQRIAIVLAPDFPRVSPTDVSRINETYPVDGRGDATPINGHPIPPFYHAPEPGTFHGQVYSFFDENGDRREECQGDLPGTSDCGTCEVNGGRCEWSPYASAFAEYNASRYNRFWVEVLDNTIDDLSGAYGADSIGLFTTLEQETGEPNEAFGLSAPLSGENIPIYPRPDHGYPIHGLDELERRLGTYGAILLVGDNTTSTFASQSRSLRAMSHGPEDVANLEPDALALEHHQALENILTAAPQAGVQVIGAIGPATATLARLGPIRGVSDVATWATPFPAPDDLVDRLRCTVDHGQDGSLPEDWDTVQPRPPCEYGRFVNGASVPTPDEDNAHNFDYIDPYTAQTRAIEDLVRQGAGSSVNIRHIGTQVAIAPQTGQTVVTAAMPHDGRDWVQAVSQSLDAAYTGSLPGDQPGWRELPPHLASPVGGTLFTTDEGMERFDGRTMQVRLLVRNSTDANGHGAFAIDSLSLFGAPRDQDIGVRFLSPEDSSSHRPGSPGLVTRVEVSNRGLQTLPQAGTLNVRVTYVGGSAIDGCELASDGPVEFDTRPLGPGSSQIIHVPLYGGIAPSPLPAPTCDLLPQDQTGRLEFRAAVDVPGDWDEDSGDDVATAEVTIREVVDLRLGDTIVEPAERLVNGPEPVTIKVPVTNLGTQTFQQAVVQLRIHDARPIMCDSSQWAEGCDSRSNAQDPVAVHEMDSILSVPQNEQKEAVFNIDLEPGVYRVEATATTQFTKSDSTAQPVPSSPARTVSRIHLASPGLEAADHGWAYDDTGFNGPSSLQTPPFSVVPHEGGSSAERRVHREGTGAHDGTYGPDAVTQDSTCQQDPPAGDPQACWLSHGWRIVDWCGSTDRIQAKPGDECEDEAPLIEWRRDGTPAYQPELDPGNLAPNQPQGYDDFGPDALVWQPHTDEGRPGPVPLSLASFGDPHLNLVTRIDATEHTAVSVEMQMARLYCFRPPSAGFFICSWEWDWGRTINSEDDGLTSYDRTLEGWFPLSIEGRTQTGLNNVSYSPYQTNLCGSSGQGLGPSSTCIFRSPGPTNELRGFGDGFPAMWGAQTGQHAGSAGWESMSIPIDPASQPGLLDYCRDAGRWTDGAEDRYPQEGTLPVGYDPCRYADVEGTPIARPIRFRIRASSYGGDVGSSVMQIQTMGLSDHQVGFEGASTVPVHDLAENEARLIPVRVENRGRVDDDVRVSWAPVMGRTGLNGRMDVHLDLENDFENARQALTLPLAPGESRIVWLRLAPDIQGVSVPAGSDLRIPVQVLVQSLRDPTAESSILIDGMLQTRAWPDLEIRKLLIGENEGTTTFDAAEGVPVEPTLILRNTGKTAIGSEDQPIHISLKAVEIHPSNGTVIPGTGEVFGGINYTKAIQPGPSDTVVNELPSWTPDRQGWFRITAHVNRPDLVDPTAQPLPEKTIEVLNRIDVDGRVGAVPFPDLQVRNAWISPLGEDGLCQLENPVNRAVDGHAYCLAATVENRGEVGALGPEVLFITGKAKHSRPPLDSAFPDDVFPPGENITVQSATWIANQRPDGSPWNMRVEASTRSATLDRDGRNAEFNVPVDSYALRLGGLPDEVLVQPNSKIVLDVTVVNRGSAPTSPITRVATDNDDITATVLTGPTRLLPGENGHIQVALQTTGSAVHSGSIVISVTTREDPKVDETRMITIKGTDAALPTFVPLPLRAEPGEADLRLAVRDMESSGSETWYIESNVDHPLAIDAQISVAGATEIVGVPAIVAPNTPPGDYSLNATAWAEPTEGVRITQPLTVPLRVLAAPDLEAKVESQTNEDEGLKDVTIRIHNAGNIPLSVLAQHEVDFGSFLRQNESLDLQPGETSNLTVGILRGESSRSLGTTALRWAQASAGTDLESTEILLRWRVDFPVAKLQIIDSDLRSIELPPNSTRAVEAKIQNIGDADVEAEALLVVDGFRHGRTTLVMESHTEQSVQLPFRTGALGTNHHLEVIVRPIGYPAGPDHDGFYQMSDALIETRVVEETSDKKLVSAPGIVALVPILMAVIAMVRRRWDA